LIYLESLENTFKNPLFGNNVLESLEKQGSTLGAQSFSQYPQIAETSYTMGAMVGTQCAIPLFPTVAFKGRNSGNDSKLLTFLPGATCLTDVLANNGYHNVLLMGSSHRFAGHDKFNAAHAIHESLSLDLWSSRYGAEDMNPWGLSDTKLMEEALNKLRHLQSNQQPFALQIFTIGGHYPAGMMSAHEKLAGCRPNDYLAAYQCSNEQLVKFIQKAKDDGLLDNTLVVMFGDHVTMAKFKTFVPNHLLPQVQQLPRTIFNQIIQPKAQQIPETYLDRPIVHFDFYPTILSLLGARIEGNRLGFGYNANAKNFPTDNPIERFKNLSQFAKNKAYIALWLPSNREN
jgi:phosphoglycerol transferase